ncbi:MAG TPA: MOSC domain-containing protein, partial [Gammaproteobacteria bacterium]|nr:MOSC domain-containing protein [Gammaproteobacteria bacterium]
GEAAVPMHRFRPNLVISGCAPYEEDSWQTINIGSCRFHVVKPCSRCVIPTIDRETAEKGREPIRTLLEYRRVDNKIYFGQNLVHELQPEQLLSVGDALEVVALR